MTRHDDLITAAALAAANNPNIPEGDPTEDLDKFAADTFNH
jgi:hypothetical protein